MVDRSDSITIDRPVEDVFGYVTDVTNDPAWHTDILEAHKTTEGSIGVGTVWHTRFNPTMGISEGDIARGDVRAEPATGDAGRRRADAPHPDL